MIERNKEDIAELLVHLQNDVEIDDFWQALGEGIELKPMPGVDPEEWKARSEALIDLDESDPTFASEQDWVVLNSAGHPYCAMSRLELEQSADIKLDVQMLYDYLQNELDIDNFSDDFDAGDSDPLPGVDRDEWSARCEALGEMDRSDPKYNEELNWTVLNTSGSAFAAMERLRLNLLQADEPEMDLDASPSM